MRLPIRAALRAPSASFSCFAPTFSAHCVFPLTSNFQIFRCLFYFVVNESWRFAAARSGVNQQSLDWGPIFFFLFVSFVFPVSPLSAHLPPVFIWEKARQQWVRLLFLDKNGPSVAAGIHTLLLIHLWFSGVRVLVC